MSRPSNSWTFPLATLQAMGTNNGVAVGQSAIVTGSPSGVYECATAGATTSTWTVLASAGGGAETLAATLGAGNTTGGTDLVVTDLDSIEAGAVGPLTMDTAAKGVELNGDLTLDHASSPTITIDKNGALDTATLLYGEAGTKQWEVQVDSTESLLFQRYLADVFQDTTLTLRNVDNRIDMAGSLLLDSASPAVTVGDGTGAGANVKIDGTTDALLQLNTDNSGTSRVNLGNDVADDRCGMRSNSSYIEMIFRAAGGDKVALGSTSIYPSSSSYDLGKSANRFDVAYVETLDADTAILGPTLHWTHHAYSESGAARDYIPWAGTSEGSGITMLSTTGLAPFDGQLKTVQISASGIGGTTTIGFHKNGNTTAEETDNVSMTVANTTYTATFTASTFSKDDRLHVSVDPGTTISLVSVTCTWEYDTRT